MASPVNETFFQQLCQHAGIATVALDTDLRVVFWNAAAERVLGRSASEIVGRPLLDVVPESRRPLAERLLKRTLTEGAVAEFDIQHHDPKGTPITLAITISPIPDAHGTTTGVALHLRDITRRTETERSLAQNRKMSALGTMAGAVAHHFNNLLGGLITTVDFARHNRDITAVQRALTSMSEPLNRAIAITRALLAFAEGDRTDNQATDVNATLDEFVQSIQPLLAEKKIALDLDLHEVHATLPRRKLTTILESLTANAAEAMPSGGCLRIELARTEDPHSFLLRVSDRGCGIQDQDLEHAFEPFFTTKARQTGTRQAHLGLGLAVVHGIAKELGGTVTLCASPQSGTICSLRLPCRTHNATAE